MNPNPSASTEREGGPHSRLRCWQCGTTHPVNLFCPACDAIQPLPAQVDYFQVLGVERRLIVDPQDLERRYFELNRRLHPDRYQTGPAQARIASLSNTAALNRAYRTLRDPVERGLYWLGLQSEHLGANNNQVPPDLAALVFEVQETLDELHGTDGHRAELLEQVRGTRAQLGQRRADLLARLERNFAAWDADATDAAVLITELKTILSALAYLRTLIRDVDKALES